jgi:DNA polymerase
MLTVVDPKGRELGLWTFDYETFWSTASKYSLKVQPVLEYVRDPRFKAHCLSAISPEGATYLLRHEEIPDFLASIDWNNIAILAHNTMFDGLINVEVYGRKAQYYCDTMSMSAGEWGPDKAHTLEAMSKRLGMAGKIKGVLSLTDNLWTIPDEMWPSFEEYVTVDSELCREAFQILRDQRFFPEKELHIIDITLKAAVHPTLEIDAALCEQEIEESDLKKERLYSLSVINEQDLSKDCMSKFINEGIGALLGSPDCFAELLRQRGVEPPMKPSPSVPGKMIYAFGKSDLEFQRLGDDPRVSDLVDARLGTKSAIKKSRAERLLIQTHGGTKPLWVPLRFCAARTHRWGGTGKINLQNLPSGRDGTDPRLRKAIKAPKGYRIGVADSSQIECRMNAWAWGQSDLLDLFRSHQDPYSQLASAMYGVPVGKNGPNKHLRPVGKAMELGLGYGMGWEKYLNSCLSGALIGQKLILTEEEAKLAVATYRSIRSKIVEGWHTLNHAIDFMTRASAGIVLNQGVWDFYRQKVLMPNDLFMHYPGISWRKLPTEVKKQRVLEDGTTEEYIAKELREQAAYQIGNEVIRIWGSKLDENLIQSTARTVIAQQAIELSKEFQILMLVHDEIVFLIPEREADSAMDFALNVLRTAPDWCSDIPFDAEGGHSDRYDVK